MSTTEKPLRAVVASRLSSMTDATTSPESQRLRGDTEAARRGFTVVGYADDLDVSATRVSPWQRKQLGWWLAHPDEFDVLVFRSIDRIARRMADFVRFLEWSDEHGIRLVCLDPDIDFSSQIGRMLGYMLAMFADMEARAITGRLKGANEYMRSIARWGSGRVPYGYRMCPHPGGKGYALEPDPETAQIVRDAVDRYFAGASTLQIARDLNRRSIPSPEELSRQRAGRELPEGKKPTQWHARTIDLIFRSPSMRNVVHHKGRPVRDETGHALRYGPPLLEDDEHRRLVAEMDRRGQRDPRRPPNGTAPLLGILVCGHCGYNLYRNVAKANKQGGESRTYRCGSRHRGLTDCPGSSVREADAEEVVYGRFMDDVGHLNVWLEDDDPGEDHSEEIAEREDALNELESDRYDGGLYRGEEGRRRFLDRYRKIEAELERLRALPSRPPGTTSKDLGITYAHEWDLMTPEDRRARMLQFHVTVSVTGKIGDAPTEERLDYDSTGVSLAELAERGHDEINPDW